MRHWSHGAPFMSVSTMMRLKLVALRYGRKPGVMWMESGCDWATLPIRINFMTFDFMTSDR